MMTRVEVAFLMGPDQCGSAVVLDVTKVIHGEDSAVLLDFDAMLCLGVWFERRVIFMMTISKENKMHVLVPI